MSLCDTLRLSQSCTIQIRGYVWRATVRERRVWFDPITAGQHS